MLASCRAIKTQSKFSGIQETKLRGNSVKSVRIRSFSGPQFPAFRLNTEIYEISLRIRPKCWIMRDLKKVLFHLANQTFTEK